MDNLAFSPFIIHIPDLHKIPLCLYFVGETLHGFGRGTTSLVPEYSSSSASHNPGRQKAGSGCPETPMLLTNRLFSAVKVGIGFRGIARTWKRTGGMTSTDLW